jgi:CRP/FNR family transcriptional regulator
MRVFNLQLNTEGEFRSVIQCPLLSLTEIVMTLEDCFFALAQRADKVVSEYNLSMDELRQLAERLRQVQHFKHFSITDLTAIVSMGQVRHFRTGETIFQEGEPCSGMYVLLRGEVHLRKMGPLGQTNILSIIKPVIMFNEVAVLDGGTNPLSAEAVEDCLIWQISYESFQVLLQRYPDMGLGLLKVLAKRNRQMLERYEDLSFRSVHARMAKLLLDLSKNGTRKIERNQHPISEMAARIASVREAISRCLQTFKSRGLIQYDRTEISVLDPQSLAKLGQMDESGIKMGDSFLK